MLTVQKIGRGLALAALVLAPAALQAADGYGRNATGGAGGTAVTVTTAAALKTECGSSSARIITVSGTIDLGTGGRCNVASNKTIKGANTSSLIKGTLQTVDNANNIIIQNLNISANTGAAASNDGISVNKATNVFITKCTVYDCTDGNIDVCKASDNVTVSWCKFYYTRNNGHNFSNLIGSSDTDTETGTTTTTKYHTTWHHNWWSTGCTDRMLADRFGPCHFYNNYFDCTGNNYCTDARNVTQMLSQNNYYDHVNNPSRKTGNGKLKSSGNTFNVCTGDKVVGNDTVFTPNYGYTLDPTTNVPTRVKGGAGNR